MKNKNHKHLNTFLIFLFQVQNMSMSFVNFTAKVLLLSAPPMTLQCVRIA